MLQEQETPTEMWTDLSDIKVTDLTKAKVFVKNMSEYHNSVSV